ncbi:TMV resistance protein N-like isoform X2 [Vigna radiata var. radiata]|uniref:TMV resistance protein N-like isoform X2 n=1 Tax=Vigna radiata var. radiata TaxID=3916 RepID=A0A1S3VDE8_VIGRR|nr:TMV resistance protein N-like isoform X2 [Vigna radiata var. radiata]
MEFASSSLSSSSSSFLKSEPHFIHDVFINFGGEDIGRRFVSHLHSVLLQNQVKTFISQENLHEGMKKEEHMRAIRRTKITIIVFSKSYTESACSILELEKIIECHETFGQIVLPVFYEIDPLDVRHQKEDFGKALEETAHRSYLGEQLQHARSRWSSALNRVAGMTGWDVRNFRHDAELVKQIVSRVQMLLDYKELFITQYTVGLESHVEDVIGCIENNSTKLCMIGIWGMGGSGKTTLAKVIYNRIYREFIGKSFIENISEVYDPENERYVDLQENLLSDVLKSKYEVESVRMGRTMIENVFSRKKLLIVLDDVTAFGQLENLCGSREWFGQGTVIIITTRNYELLDRLKVNYVHLIGLMNEKDSLELFRCHAFREGKPRKYFNELARNVADYSRGHPLALNVLGSFLCDRTMKEWKSVLSKLKRTARSMDNHVLDVLKISFEGLRDTEKDIFLDVCCFFIGKERSYVTDILNGCGLDADIGITILIDCGLIKIGKNNTLEMRPLFRDMGREIIQERCSEEPGKMSRLWFQDDVKDVLKKNTGTEAIQGLSLKLHSTSRDFFKANAFKEMKRLRLLQLYHVQLVGDYGCLSKELRWICWKGFSSKYIPNNFHMKNVISIDLRHSHLQLVWKQPLWKKPQVLERLKFLNLSHSRYLIETPDFSVLPSLEQLILKDCPSLLKGLVTNED